MSHHIHCICLYRVVLYYNTSYLTHFHCIVLYVSYFNSSFCIVFHRITPLCMVLHRLVWYVCALYVCLLYVLAPLILLRPSESHQKTTLLRSSSSFCFFRLFLCSLFVFVYFKLFFFPCFNLFFVMIQFTDVCVSRST